MEYITENYTLRGILCAFIICIYGHANTLQVILREFDGSHDPDLLVLYYHLRDCSFDGVCVYECVRLYMHVYIYLYICI